MSRVVKRIVLRERERERELTLTPFRPPQLQVPNVSNFQTLTNFFPFKTRYEVISRKFHLTFTFWQLTLFFAAIKKNEPFFFPFRLAIDVGWLILRHINSW